MKIAALVSGGVDSSVALALSKHEGHDVKAYYFKIWHSSLEGCPWEEDLGYASRVCDQLGVELEVLNLATDYEFSVLAYLFEELQYGRTPNPDVLCNSFIKFGAALDYIPEDRTIVTGHYAEVRDGLLYRNPDPVKDQSFFLSRLRPDQIARAKFPLGPYCKTEVRRMAKELDLPTQERPDSQGLCFLGRVDYAAFLKANLPASKGRVIDSSNGKVLGEHDGSWLYTIGQRKGLRLGGGPWYVTQKNRDTVYVTHASKLELVGTFPVHRLNFEPGPADVFVKYRHPSQPVEATFDGTTVRLKEVREIGFAPGQVCAFYLPDGRCLGSGFIA